MTEPVVPILWATHAAVMDAGVPVHSDDLPDAVRSMLPRAVGARLVADEDVLDAAATLLILGLLASTGDDWEPGRADPRRVRITDRDHVRWWRARDKREADLRRASRRLRRP